MGPPGPGPGLGLFGHALGAGLSTAANYLGVSESDLISQLSSGKTLAQIADSTSGKSAQGLIDALVASEKTELQQAVTNGQLTQTQADRIEQSLTAAVTALVHGTRPALPHLWHGGTPPTPSGTHI